MTTTLSRGPKAIFLRPGARPLEGNRELMIHQFGKEASS